MEAFYDNHLPGLVTDFCCGERARRSSILEARRSSLSNVVINRDFFVLVVLEEARYSMHNIGLNCDTSMTDLTCERIYDKFKRRL